MTAPPLVMEGSEITGEITRRRRQAEVTLEEGSGMGSGIASGMGSGLGSGIILGESGSGIDGIDSEVDEELVTEAKSGLLTADNVIPVTSKRAITPFV